VLKNAIKLSKKEIVFSRSGRMKKFFRAEGCLRAIRVKMCLYSRARGFIMEENQTAQGASACADQEDRSDSHGDYDEALWRQA